MNWKHANEPVRCDLCRRAVDRDTRERARWAFQPLVICDSCVREADTRFSAGHAWAPVAA